MKRVLTMMLTALMALSLVATVSAQEEPVLNIFTWDTYIDGQTLANFTEETGIQINYTPFNSNEEMLIKMSAPDNGFDLILASDYAINILRKEGQLLALDKEQLPNYDNLDPAFLGKYYDENNEYTVPYTAGTPLIVYNADYVDIPITGYESLWDEALRDSVTVIDDARNIIGITLKTLGHSFNTTDDEALEAAKEKLMALRPNIRSFNYDTPHQDLLSGEVSVAYMFTPFVMLALMENPDLQVVYPEEGMGFGIDSLVISADAPHPGNAHKLMNYLLDGEVAAFVAQQQLYLSPVAAAKPFIPEELRDNPALNIPAEILGETEFIMDLGEYESVYQQIWTEFKLN